MSQHTSSPSSSSDPLVRRFPFFYGWVMVAVAVILYYISGPGQTYSVSVFVDPMLEELQWSRSRLSGAYSLATLAAAAGTVLTGRLLDRFGHRWLTAVAMAGLAGACLLMSWAGGLAAVTIGYFGLRLFGQSALTLIPSTLIAQWFKQRRGRAQALAALGMAAGTATVPLLSNTFIDLWGWRGAWYGWALLLVLVLPLAALLVRGRPEQVGLRIDGGPVTGSDPMGPVIQTVPAVSFTLREAARTRAFWLLLVATMFPSLISSGIIFHLVSVLGQRGLPPVAAATLFTFTGAAYLLSIFLAGYGVDRMPIRLVVAIWLGLDALSLLFLLYGPASLVVPVFGLSRGIVWGIHPIVAGTLWVSYFGYQHLGSIQGIAMAAMVTGSALGPLPLGLSYDRLGTYAPLLATLAGLALLMAALVTTARPPRA